MRIKSVVFFTLLTGLSLTIVGAEDNVQEKNFEYTYDSTAQTSYSSSSKNLFLELLTRLCDTFRTRLYNTLRVISGPYLLELIKEHPMKSMAFAIVIGIITNENKKNIIEGIKKLRNSAYRVIGFGLKTDEESTTNEQKKEIKFVESVDLNNGSSPNSGKFLVLDF